MNGWNLLDFSVLLLSIIDFFLTLTSNGMKLKAFKSLRAIRAIWPLRMFSKNEGLKVVVNSLLNSIPQMFNVLIVILIFIIIFSIMGVSFFSGKFYYCENFQHEVFNKIDCLNQGGIWKWDHSHFDDIFSAMSSLFQLINNENWFLIMF